MSEIAQFDVSQSNYVKANVSNSHNDNVAMDIKFCKDITIKKLKNKLEIVTGGLASTMKVELYQGERYLTSLDNNEAKLGDYLTSDGIRLHVVDKFTNYCLDSKSTRKFELTNDQYDQRTDSVRNFLKQNQLGKYNGDEMSKLEAKRREHNENVKKRAELCVIGSRCQVTLAGKPTRRGTIMYNGPIEDKTGIFIGIKYDGPLGINNGR